MTERNQRPESGALPQINFLNEINLEDIGVGITKTSKLTGVSISRIQYWTDRDYVQSIESESYLYDLKTLRKIKLIRELSDRGGKENGMKLKTAVKKTEELMQSKNRVGNQAIYCFLKAVFNQRLDELAVILEKRGLAKKIIEVTEDKGG